MDENELDEERNQKFEETVKKVRKIIRILFLMTAFSKEDYVRHKVNYMQSQTDGYTMYSHTVTVN